MDDQRHCSLCEGQYVHDRCDGMGLGPPERVNAVRKFVPTPDPAEVRRALAMWNAGQVVDIRPAMAAAEAWLREHS